MRPVRGPKFLRLLSFVVFFPILGGCFPSSSNDQKIRIPLGVDLANYRITHPSIPEFSAVNSQLFETLVQIGQDKRVVPALASRWEFDEDFLYLDIERGVYFHNGIELTSSHVVASLKDLVLEMTTLVPEIEGPYRIRIPHLGLQFELLSLLSLPEFSITLDGFGTGPFRYSRHSGSGSLILEKNTNYRIPGMPLVDSLEFFGSVPLAFQVQGFLRREFDIVPVVSIEDRVLLEAAGVGRSEVHGLYEYRVATGLRNFSIYLSTGGYDFRRVVLVQEDGRSP